MESSVTPFFALNQQAGAQAAVITQRERCICSPG
jgi:hypothetical protein